jgi:hypothetical protein
MKNIADAQPPIKPQRSKNSFVVVCDIATLKTKNGEFLALLFGRRIVGAK